ncbi:cation:proton antiporter [Pediococcus damnosus]|uniref:cation:proton antiporter n=1 Tax=Pediococcus damnosus TaxID=51663 RepID=UPI000C1C903B|nr:sodium:proton antiporter [Pediococcus damnosus]PIO86150.1 sodium:proton antiporter [Pediococcus damnosus]
MSLLLSSFVILIAVAASDIIAKSVPHISSTYINLLMGIVLGLIPFTNHLVLDFNDEIFMAFIIAPLLFFEGQSTPALLIKRKIKSILGTAVGLAAVSAIVIALVVHQVFALAIPVALMITAISTPTDATAFDSVIEGRTIDERIKKSLKLESLFNDATGIILLQAAFLWLQTGQVAFGKNVLSFFYSAGGGIIVGAILSLIVMAFRQFLVRSSVNVISSQTLIYLLTPFCIYFIAEGIGVSGIIAVVTAGLIHNSETTRSRFSSPRQMHLGLELVNFANNVLNSFVFVVLGLSLERIVMEQRQSMENSMRWLGIGVLVYVGLLAARYVYGRFFITDRTNRSACLFALGGVHGTVTLAMTFSVLSNGVSQALFNEVVLIETVVIILSMLVPTLIFKAILPIDADAFNKSDQLKILRNEMVIVGIQHVKTMNLSEKVCEVVIYDLRDQVQKNTMKAFFRQWQSVTTDKATLTSIQSVDQRRALMQAFDAERAFLYDLAKNHMVNSEYIYDIFSEILLSESLVLDPQNQVI